MTDLELSRAPHPAMGTVAVLRGLMVAAVLVPALLVGLAALQSWTVLLEEAEQRTDKTAAILQQHAAATLEIYALVYSRVQDYLRSREAPPTPADLHLFLQRLDDDVGQIEAVFIADAEGQLAAHSRFAPPFSVNIADRDYFRALRDGERLAIGEPIIGRLSRERRINIARRLEGPGGRFDGIVAISVSESYFSAYFRTLQEDPRDVLNIVRLDGRILVRTPPPPEGQADYQPGAFRPLLTNDDRGVYRKVATLDGVERIYAYRRVVGYPLFVSFGLQTTAVVQQWRGQVMAYAAIAVPAALLLLLATWIALRRARQEEAAFARLRQEIGQRAVAESAREDAEKALRQAQKMEALGQLTGGIAHDFNNLLTVIAGNIDLVLKRLDEPTLTRRLQASLRATERGQKLTQQLLAFARRRPLRSVAVRLADHVADLTGFLGQTMGSDIAIETLLPDGLWDVHVDDEQLQVALLNLIVNARDAMPEGGRIRIAARNVTLPDAGGAPAVLSGDFVALSVADTGQGIPPDVLPRVFEPFFTTKSVGRGSGLGLAQVYSFAQQSNGAVDIASEPGSGTTVTLYLPRSAAPAQPRETPAEPVGATAERARRVLVVEDDPEVADVARGYLESFGYEAVVVDRAAKALDVLSGDARFDLVFSDVVMPDGMSGLDLARQLAGIHPQLPVLLASGYAGEPREGMRIGADVLRKPYNTRSLKEAIDRTIAPVRSGAGA